MKQKWITILAVACMGLGLSTSFAAATDPFITDWDLSKPGSGPNQIQFFAYSSGPVTYSWITLPASSNSGSGTFYAGSSGNTITISGLPTSAIIRLSVDTAHFQSFSQASSDNSRLINVQQWGTTLWRSMKGAFINCNNLQIEASDEPNLSRVTDMNGMFSKCIYLNTPTNINNWDVSNVSIMKAMFGDDSIFNQNIGDWNVSNVTDMSEMFAFASNFNQNISNWNVSNVKDMSFMFNEAISFNQRIDYWDVSNVTNLSWMFCAATSFNQNIGNWNVKNVTNMTGTFAGANLFNQKIGNWDISNVTDMNAMFYRAKSFDQSLAPWAIKLNPNASWNNHYGGYLDSCGMSVANYDSTLIAFNAFAPTGFTMSAAGLKYCAAATARANLVKPIASGGKGWTITGDTIASPSCVTISALNPSNSGSINTMAFIYPNPAQDWATISLANGNEGNIEISNELGQVIYSQKVKDQENISLAGLKSGIYSFKVNQDKSIQHLRVVKQ